MVEDRDRTHEATSPRWENKIIGTDCCLKCLLHLRSSEIQDPFDEFYACSKKNSYSFYFREFDHTHNEN